jgi:Zn ribbon nucleic-acid-binding protein
MINDVRFLHHEPCPQCGSRDNLGVWSDGHKWCFGCNYYVSGSIKNVFNSVVIRPTGSAIGAGVSLPSDYTTSIPKQGRDWLKKYYLTDKEIYDNRIGWSQTGWFLTKKEQQIAPLLILPVFADSQLVMWQGRNFGSVGPKYLTMGNKGVYDVIHGSRGMCDSVCITEDKVSAIKVGRYVDAMPAYGSSLNMEQMLHLSKGYDNLLIWLDHDKLRESHRLAKRAGFMFKDVRVIDSHYDPKDYMDDEIKEFINGVS